ncbi:hypothetical protein AAFF_G00259320 [Aldrovandia affinis]|uniref:Uncharacterized protein n=1 Tax=Aldrovandia affinis TaxID=143900 RepID=A0AAD7STR0_9TELE|nr:hypothetical protein AAFF_G00259320 [Aldrovandia affinis]
MDLEVKSLSMNGLISDGASTMNTMRKNHSTNQETKLKRQGGEYFVAADNLDSNALIDVFASLTTSDGDPTRQVIQLESSGNKTDPKAWFNGTVSVDKTAHMNQQHSDGSKPMLVYAEVSQKGIPVTLADVWATIESSAGGKHELQLLDNGAGADVLRHDGIYSRYFTGLKDGKFSLKVKVKNQEGKARPAIQSHSRALYIPGYVVNGNVEPNPPKPPVNEDDLHVDVGSFTRTAIGESFIVTLTPGKPPPTFPPNRITDLSASIVKDQVLLIWTAPGEELDQGTAQSYEIRMSKDFDLLRSNFSHANLIDMTSRQPQEAGSREEHSFLPNNTTIKNGTILYFAVRAQDNDSLTSSISNIAQTLSPGL